ncbi:hypothetical protein Poli38472_002937 [Pythium oligandrum]|uniref:Uncharacterized protein n=1 Tax=Pythium oligandrum TaxID=41045 RepID=A0A8K1C6N0_PYTOL|nr:hypothetical protein Poli38472_002937 [Pythium oligandrum]|eukprot:TMW57012.1 hypothetical protein Poli38472_002937 [Pythium oligandrum]
MAMATTFAFSDEELLDALTAIDGMDDATLTRASNPAIPALEAYSLAEQDVDLPALVVTDDASNSCLADADDTASTTSASEHGSSTDAESDKASSQALTTTDGNKPGRKRRKHELDAMRALATTLENQLTQLKKRQQAIPPGTNLFWKRVSDQLSLERQRSATENARLRDIFQDQTKVLSAVQRSLQKTPDLVKLGVVESKGQAIGEFKPPDVYQKLFQDVTHAYSGTDSVLMSSGVSQNSTESRRVNMEMLTEDGRSVMRMQVSESRELPFDVKTVGEGIWQFLSKDCEDENDSENKFRRVLKARGDNVFGVSKLDCSVGLFTLNGDVALRRFVEDNRLTFVWECMGVCENPSSPSESFRLQDRGWSVFEPCPSDPQNKSIFRSCVQFSPKPMDPNGELSTSAKDIGLLTEISLGVYQSTIGTIYESVLAELMNEMLRI